MVNQPLTNTQLSLGLSFHNNHYLFSDHYLDKILKRDARWLAAIADAEKFLAWVTELYRQEQAAFIQYKEPQLETHWFKPIFRQLGHVFEGQISIPGLKQNIRFPDYVFYPDDAARQQAVARQGSAEAVEQAIKNGELYTGDIGYLDEEGDLWLVQRRSDLIVSGGENVYPAEVEAVLHRHPAVQEVCVVGVPDVEWGQQVAAMVVFVPGREATADELTAFGREHLAGYKLPRRYLFVDELPQTASGKVYRADVQFAFIKPG